LLVWLIVGAVRQGTTGSEMDQRTLRTEVGATPLAPLLSSASTGSYTACWLHQLSEWKSDWNAGIYREKYRITCPKSIYC